MRCSHRSAESLQTGLEIVSDLRARAPSGIQRLYFLPVFRIAINMLDENRGEDQRLDMPDSLANGYEVEKPDPGNHSQRDESATERRKHPQRTVHGVG